MQQQSMPSQAFMDLAIYDQKCGCCNQIKDKRHDFRPRARTCKICGSTWQAIWRSLKFNYGHEAYTWLRQSSLRRYGFTMFENHICNGNSPRSFDWTDIIPAKYKLLKASDDEDADRDCVGASAGAASSSAAVAAAPSAAKNQLVHVTSPRKRSRFNDKDKSDATPSSAAAGVGPQLCETKRHDSPIGGEVLPMYVLASFLSGSGALPSIETVQIRESTVEQDDHLEGHEASNGVRLCRIKVVMELVVKIN